MTFLEVWVGYAIVGTLIFTVMFSWAVRARQFWGMGRAGSIPLDADTIPDEEQPGPPSRSDRWALIVIAVVSAAILASTLWAAFAQVGGVSPPS